MSKRKLSITSPKSGKVKKASARTSIMKPVTKRTTVARRSVSNLVIKGNNIEHVLPLGNGWVVKNESSKTFTAITDTQKEAVALGRQIAKRKQIKLIVHGKDGRIISLENYII
jgi:uncharacterized protein YdaT